jgi:hypothetical protein
MSILSFFVYQVLSPPTGIAPWYISFHYMGRHLVYIFEEEVGQIGTEDILGLKNSHAFKEFSSNNTINLITCAL